MKKFFLDKIRARPKESAVEAAKRAIKEKLSTSPGPDENTPGSLTVTLKLQGSSGDIEIADPLDTTDGYMNALRPNGFTCEPVEVSSGQRQRNKFRITQSDTNHTYMLSIHGLSGDRLTIKVASVKSGDADTACAKILDTAGVIAKCFNRRVDDVEKAELSLEDFNTDKECDGNLKVIILSTKMDEVYDQQDADVSAAKSAGNNDPKLYREAVDPIRQEARGKINEYREEIEQILTKTDDKSMNSLKEALGKSRGHEDTRGAIELAAQKKGGQQQGPR